MEVSMKGYSHVKESTTDCALITFYTMSTMFFCLCKRQFDVCIKLHANFLSNDISGLEAYKSSLCAGDQPRQRVSVLTY